MKVVFFGSPEFAIPSLTALSNHPDIDITLVITQPDRRAGRGRMLQPPPVKQMAERVGFAVLQPESLRSPEIRERIAESEPDAGVLVSYGELLRSEILELPPHGILNVHPSLLPKYRGATPIPAAILNGDSDSGVSIIKLVRRLDAGPILRQVRYPMSGSESSGSLSNQLAELAASVLPETLLEWVRGEIEPVDQDESQATWTYELRKDDARIDWNQPCGYLERFVRAMDPWPRAWTMLDDRRVVIHEVRVVDGGITRSLAPGELQECEGRLLAGTGEGTIELVKIQPAGKSQMPATAWFRGLASGQRSTFC